MKTKILAIALAFLAIAVPTAFADLIVSGSATPSTLAPQRAIVPVVTITCANTGTNWVNVGNIRVRKKGTVPDDNFGKVLLLRDDGLIGDGLIKLDLNHEAVLIGYPVIGNQSRQWTIAIEMAEDVSRYAGQTVGLDIISVETDGTTSGTFPITGAMQTITAADIAGDFNIQNSAVVTDTNISIGLQNQIIAGPVDVNIGEAVTSHYGFLHFSDPITLQSGATNRWFVKGRVGNSFQSQESKIRLSVNTDGIIIAFGLTYGYGFPSTQHDTVLGDTMTVKGPLLGISTSSVSNTIVSLGGANVIVGATVFDATQSSEDIRVTALRMNLTTSNLSALSLTSCRIWDGAVAINTDLNIVNPSTNGEVLFAFDGTGFIVPKGTLKSLVIRGELTVGTQSGSLRWDVSTNQAYSGYPLSVSVISGQAVYPTVASRLGDTITAMGTQALVTSIQIHPAVPGGAAPTLRLQGIGNFSIVYYLESSTDLQHWYRWQFPLQNNNGNISYLGEIKDTNVTAKFFRIVAN